MLLINLVSLIHHHHCYDTSLSPAFYQLFSWWKPMLPIHLNLIYCATLLARKVTPFVKQQDARGPSVTPPLYMVFQRCKMHYSPTRHECIHNTTTCFVSFQMRQLQCACCSATYVRQTGRYLDQWLYEHHCAVESGDRLTGPPQWHLPETSPRVRPH